MSQIYRISEALKIIVDRICESETVIDFQPDSVSSWKIWNDDIPIMSCGISWMISGLYWSHIQMCIWF